MAATIAGTTKTTPGTHCSLVATSHHKARIKAPPSAPMITQPTCVWRYDAVSAESPRRRSPSRPFRSKTRAADPYLALPS